VLHKNHYQLVSNKQRQSILQLCYAFYIPPTTFTLPTIFPSFSTREHKHQHEDDNLKKNLKATEYHFRELKKLAGEVHSDVDSTLQSLSAADEHFFSNDRVCVSPKRLMSKQTYGLFTSSLQRKAFHTSYNRISISWM